MASKKPVSKVRKPRRSSVPKAERSCMDCGGPFFGMEFLVDDEEGLIRHVCSSCENEYR